MADIEPKYVLVRSPAHLSAEGQIGYGWNQDDFGSFSSEAELVKNFKGRCGRRLNQIKLYYNLKKGDVVVVPVSRGILIGRVSGARSFHPDAKDAWYSANRLSVDYICRPGSNKPARIPREHLQEGFSRRLRIRQSIASLGHFKPQIDQIIECIESGRRPSSRDERYEALNGEAIERFKEELSQRLTNGKTYLEAGGKGLELLIQALLRCEGYDAEILGKKGQPSGIDIDIEATLAGVVSYKLLVQVKHHKNVSGAHGIKQLANHIKAHQDDDQNVNQVTSYLFVTTANSISESARNLAEENGIFVVDLDGIVDWTTERITEVSSEALASLNVANIPQFIS